METLSAPPAIELSNRLYCQLVYTPTDLLPPPLDNSAEALRARNHAAVAKVAALVPVGANELDLVAQCIAARAKAEEMLRLVRQHAGDIEWVIRLKAQYGSMVRTSLSVVRKLMRVQAVPQKRDAIEGAATADAWTLHAAERSMLRVADPEFRRSSDGVRRRGKRRLRSRLRSGCRRQVGRRGLRELPQRVGRILMVRLLRRR